MDQLYERKSLVQKAENDNLFFGVWMRWRALTVGERFVCANIILVPVWWVAGVYKYMPLLLLLGVALYEWLQYGGLRLKRPSLPVIALLAFGMYQVAKIFLFYYDPARPSVSGIVLSWFSYGVLLWYIQSNKIRIRVEVVAWACTVSVVQMIGFWLLLQFVLPEDLFLPVGRIPTLFGLLASKGSENPGDVCLEPYETSSGNVAGLYRLSLFFISSQFFSIVAAFIGLVALEIKNRFWSLLLFLACVFLIVLSTTRAVWVAFPIVLGLRYLFSTFGGRRGRPIFFALVAVASFTTLSLPQFTDLVLEQFTNTAQSIDQFRASSTDDRMEIYRQTWRAIQENPLWGHVGEKPAISLNGASYNVVGSHSVILGDLLYSNGLVGTVIFTVFWISLFMWLYRTRSGRPLASFCFLLMLTLVSPTVGALFDISLSPLMVLLCVAFSRSKPKSAANESIFRTHYA